MGQDDIRVLFDGKRVDLHRSPKDHGMEDMDKIEVTFNMVGGNLI